MKRSEFFKSLLGACCAVPLLAKEKSIEAVKITKSTETGHRVATPVDSHQSDDWADVIIIDDPLTIKNSAGDVFPQPQVERHMYEFEPQSFLSDKGIAWDPSDTHSYAIWFKGGDEATTYINNVEQKNWKGTPSGTKGKLS